MNKVLIIATSNKTRGGITSVVNAHKKRQAVARISLQMDRNTYRQRCRMEDLVSDKRLANIYMSASVL